MSLRKDLKKKVEESLLELKIKVRKTKDAQNILEQLNLRKANYIVSLESLWSDSGEKSITFRYNGSIELAIKGAEEEFMSVNNRNNIQANYGVGILLGELEYSLPEAYWKKYVSKD